MYDEAFQISVNITEQIPIRHLADLPDLDLHCLQNRLNVSL